MLEIVTNSGAIIHIDPENDHQVTMSEVAIAAFGGIDFKMEVESNDK